MTVEERFGIEISNEEAERIVKPRELIDLILSKTGCSDVAICRSRRAFHVLRRALIHQFGLNRNAIRPTTQLRRLIRFPARRQNWQTLQSNLRVTKWPELRPPVGLTLAVLVAVVAMVMLAWSNASMPKAVLITLATSAVAVWMLRIPAFRVAFPASANSVGGLSQFLAGQAPELFEPAVQRWARVEVANQVREIVIDVIGCKNYSEDARFVEDLGLS